MMKKNKKKSKSKLILLILTILGLSLAFFYLNKIAMEKTKRFSELEQVTVNLKWLHQTQFAGHYVADQKGFYEENGIKVNLIPFDYESFPIDEVLLGRAQFGVAGADELLIARSNGAKVRAIAVIYQDSPVVAYTLKSSGIEIPEDMIGKKIGIQQGVNVELTVKAMIERKGIKYNEDIEIVPIGFDVDPLINGEVDVATGYETNEPIQVESAGHPVNIIAPYKNGIKFYGDVLFTSEELIEKNPDLVDRFVRATLKGWEYALNNHDEAVNFTLLYHDPNNVSLNYDHQLKLLEKSHDLIKPTKGVNVGEMDYLNWKRTYDLLLDSNLISKEVNVRNSFTIKFLE